MTNLTPIEAELQHAVDVFRSQIAALHRQWVIDLRNTGLKLDALYRHEPSMRGLVTIVSELCKMVGRLAVFEWRRHRLLRGGRKLVTIIRSMPCKDPTP